MRRKNRTAFLEIGVAISNAEEAKQTKWKMQIPSKVSALSWEIAFIRKAP